MGRSQKIVISASITIFFTVLLYINMNKMIQYVKPNYINLCVAVNSMFFSRFNNIHSILDITKKPDVGATNKKDPTMRSFFITKS